jgi:F-type H+-transporting ATPase subunit epsilon
MKLKVITPDAPLWSGNITSINIAEKEGSFSILKGHAPLITVVKNVLATITIETGEVIYIAAGSGIIKVLTNEVSVIIDYGVIGNSKEEAKNNLVNLREVMIQNSSNLGDDTIANLEIELMRLTKLIKS